ncbi:DUF5004 domain-containing protein [Mucilaginibacter koreensis]
MKVKNVIGQAFLLTLVCIIISVSACKTEKIIPAQEPAKDISGKWQVIKATRNGTDITKLVDFSKFRVSFDAGKYTLLDKLPFLVNQDGSYSLDDPQYPFQIAFTANGGKAVATSFTYPIVNGVRQLSITFSPGCANNNYVYVFQKASN